MMAGNAGPLSFTPSDKKVLSFIRGSGKGVYKAESQQEGSKCSFTLASEGKELVSRLIDSHGCRRDGTKPKGEEWAPGM